MTWIFLQSQVNLVSQIKFAFLFQSKSDPTSCFSFFSQQLFLSFLFKFGSNTQGQEFKLQQETRISRYFVQEIGTRVLQEFQDLETFVQEFKKP